MGVAIAAGVVALAAGIGSAYMKGDAARKAANAKKDAIGMVERINVGSEQDIALRYDRNRFKNQLDLQKEFDPVTGQIREAGLKGVLAGIDSPDDEKALALARTLADENIDKDPGIEAIKTKLIDDALADLERGAELPPEFQAELVRSGMEAGASSGLGFAKGAAGEQASRRLLGEAGIALKSQRQQTAAGAATLGMDLSATRANILSSVAGLLTNLTAAKFGKSMAGVELANATMPEAGLSGADAVNLDLARINQQQQLTLALGDIEASKRMAQGEMYAEMIGSAGNAVGGMLGGMGGLGGGGGSAGGMLGGLFGGGGVGTTQVATSGSAGSLGNTWYQIGSGWAARRNARNQGPYYGPGYGPGS